MATTEETTKETAKAAKPAPQPKTGGKRGEKTGSTIALDAAPKAQVGKPRLQTHYETVVRAAMTKEFGLTNPHEIPRITKVVLNVGMGEAHKQPKLLDAVIDELMLISGQRPVTTRAKKAIANFGLRAGMPIGAAVTLRGARMYEWLDRFINVAIPRMRDFRGLPNKSFDGRGNYSFGIKEQMVFPEIDFDKVEQIHGMDITIVTTAGRDDLALALLRQFGWPFRGETPVRVG